MAWFEATEGVDGRTLHLAVGFVREAESWRIGWLTLAREPQSWSWEAGRVHALADFAYAETGRLAAPRSWLDLAWHRLHGRPEPPLRTLPGARFGCHGSTVCCDVGFNIEVPPGAQALVDAVPWAELGRPDLVGTRLEAREDGRLRVKGVGDRCRFLDGQHRCMIHAHLGRQPFPPCAIFPLLFRETPDGVSVAASQVCGSARANLGPLLAERSDDLWDRLALRLPEAVPAYRIEADGPADWPAFSAAEEALLAVLARDDLSLARRLWLGCRRLDGVSGPALEVEAPPVANDAEGAREALLARLTAHFALPLPEAGLGQPMPAEAEAALAGVLRNQLYAKTLSGDHGLRVAHHAGVLAHALVRRAGGHPSEGLLWRLSGVMLHGGLTGAFKAHPDLEEMMSQPSFGAWLLG